MQVFFNDFEGGHLSKHSSVVIGLQIIEACCYDLVSLLSFEIFFNEICPKFYKLLLFVKIFPISR